MISINHKVKRIVGLAPDDLSEWEQSFISSIDDLTNFGTDCSRLSDKQIEVIARIFAKHFAG